MANALQKRGQSPLAGLRDARDTLSKVLPVIEGKLEELHAHTEQECEEVIARLDAQIEKDKGTDFEQSAVVLRQEQDAVRLDLEKLEAQRARFEELKGALLDKKLWKKFSSLISLLEDMRAGKVDASSLPQIEKLVWTLGKRIYVLLRDFRNTWDGYAVLVQGIYSYTDPTKRIELGTPGRRAIDETLAHEIDVLVGNVSDAAIKRLPLKKQAP